tara:strand:+ start:4316 stop:4915 length:600 start_codon:yes stop_codon:yes gene_type:complete
MGTRSLTRVIPVDGNEVLDIDSLKNAKEKDINKHAEKFYIALAKYVKSHTMDGSPEGSLINLYRQYDGHMYGHGLDLADFLKDLKVVNGIRSDLKSSDKIANGAECLSAQLVSHFKKEAGGFYLMKFKDEVGAYSEEYIYNIYVVSFTLSATNTKFLIHVSVNDVYKDERDPDKYKLYSDVSHFLDDAKGGLKKMSNTF